MGRGPEDWDRWLAEREGPRLALPETVFEIERWLGRLPTRETKTVADLGCGLGARLPLLAARFGEVIAVDYAPLATRHDPVDRQREAGEHQRIKDGLAIVTYQHRALVIKHNEVGKLTLLQHARPVATGRRPASQSVLEQTSTGMSPANGRNISGLRYKSLPILQPTQLFKLVDRNMAVGSNRNASVVREPRL